MIVSPEVRLRRFAMAFAISLVALFAIATNASAVTSPQVATNYYSGCAVLNSGAVSCWGGNGYGELGNGTFATSLVPVAVSGITNAVSITMGDEHVCVLLADQTVRCWGGNGNGQLGDSTTDNRNTPVTPVDLGAVKQISSSDYTTCAVLVDDTVKCWGSNPAGMIGNGNSNDVSTPFLVPGLSNVAKIQAAPDNICALLKTGRVKCSGTNAQGELGTGVPGGDSATPVDVIEVASATDLAGGNEFACALISNGSVKCWGEGGSYKQGNGSTSDQPTPTEIPGLAGVVALAPGYNNMCALLVDRSVRCWGSNGDGQAGIGNTDTVTTPQQPLNLPPVQSLSTITEATPCAIVAGGQIYCWGISDYGQGGNGATDVDLLTPTAITNLNVNVVPYPAQQVSIGVTGKAKVDRKKINYTVTGSVSTTPSQFVDPASACTGAVTVTTSYKYPGTKIVKKRGKRIKRKVTKTKTITTPAALASSGGNCLANFTLAKLPVKYLNKKSISIKGTYAGNASLGAFEAAISYKLPKVTIKCKKGYRLTSGVCKKARKKR